MMAGFFEWLKRAGRIIPPPAWPIAKIVLGSILLGSPAIIDVAESTVKWANDASSKTSPNASQADLEIIGKLLITLADDLAALRGRVTKLEELGREDQAKGYIRGVFRNDDSISPILQQINNLAQTCHCLEQQNRDLLHSYQYTQEIMAEMLSNMRRIAGVAPLVNDLRSFKIQPKESCVLLYLFQEGAASYAANKPAEAAEAFRSLQASVPGLPAAEVALATVQAIRVDPTCPEAVKCFDNLRKWASIQDGKGSVGPISARGLQELKIKDASRITDDWLACNFPGLPNLDTLWLWKCDQVTDRGLECLSDLPNLQDLNLRGCNRMTDQGLTHLCKLPRLKKLLLWGGRWSSASIDSIHRALPDLTKFDIRPGQHPHH